jgi:hypothetical protein
MDLITIACLDMAGTTVADDGGVLAAFAAAIERCGVAQGTPAHDLAMQTAAVETGPLVWSKATIQTGNVWYRSRLAMVNSPSTSATVSTVAESRAVRRFGRITRHSVISHPAPSELAASTRVRSSSARSPASSDR